LTYTLWINFILPLAFMQSFTIRDLRDKSGELTREAEAGRLSLVTRHGQPLFVSVPFTDELIEAGVHTALAVNMFKSGALSLGQAAKVARMAYSDFIEYLGALKIPVATYEVSEVDREVEFLTKSAV
jgi:predicted HTH domain antitoxin